MTVYPQFLQCLESRVIPSAVSGKLPELMVSELLPAPPATPTAELPLGSVVTAVPWHPPCPAPGRLAVSWAALLSQPWVTPGPRLPQRPAITIPTPHPQEEKEKRRLEQLERKKETQRLLEEEDSKLRGGRAPRAAPSKLTRAQIEDSLRREQQHREAPEPGGRWGGAGHGVGSSAPY